jgi:hypothetical protein
MKPKWTCGACRREFDSPCFHACRPSAKRPSSPPIASPLARVKKAEGRVDLLIARLIAEAVKHAKNPILPKAYAEVQPVVESLLNQKLGPRTRRGKKLAKDLFALRELMDQIERRRQVA